jgi:hypothetical protein
MTLVLPTRRAVLLSGPWAVRDLWRRAQATPALDLRFADNKNLTDVVTGQSLITFTRASTGTYVDADGVLKTASTDVARFDHNPTTNNSLGLLIEGQRTNSFQQSQDFSNAYWNSNANVTITTAAGIAPDGTATANLITPGSGTVNARTGRNSAGTSAVNRVYSFFAKANGIRYITITTSTATRASCFDLFTGQFLEPTADFVASSSAVAYPSGWWRISHTTATGTVPYVVAGTSFTRLATTATATFNGTDGFFLWGAQWENQQTTPTSYIPTTTAAVTRSADVASIGSTNFSSWYNQSSGTIYAEYRTPASETRGIAGLNDNTANERIELYSSTTDPKLIVVDGGVTQVDLDGGVIAASVMTQTAAAFAANDFAIVHAGGVSVTDASGTMPTPDRILIGADQAGNYQNGIIKRLIYWPVRLSDAILREVTR